MSKTPDFVSDYQHVFLPYCLMQLADGRYLAVNRKHKPVGVVTQEWVNYEEIPHVAKLTIPEKLKGQLDWRGKSDDDRIYLYVDGQGPTLSPENWNAYQARLQLLATCQVTR